MTQAQPERTAAAVEYRDSHDTSVFVVRVKRRFKLDMIRLPLDSHSTAPRPDDLCYDRKPICCGAATLRPK